MLKKVVIYDDSVERLDSVCTLLGLSGDMECAGKFLNCHNILEEVRGIRPDLILMDINMPGMNGIEATRLVKSEFPTIPIIMQTIYEEDDKVFESLRAGAGGYLLKKMNPEKLIGSLRDALSGGAPMSSSIAAKVLSYFAEEAQSRKDYNLSDREKEILKLLVDGHSYKSIASECHISFNTVNNHIRNIYTKLYVSNATAAVSLAIREKLI